MASDPLEKIPARFVEPVAHFLTWLELERGLSRHTVEAYARDLGQFAGFLDAQGVPDWSAVDAAIVNRWSAELSRSKYARSSQSRKLSAVRMLARHLVGENFRKDNFSELATSPKQSRKLPEVLTAEEVARLLDAPSRESAHGLRDRAILELFYSSGLRVSELCGLLIQSVNLEEGFLRVFGKGGRIEWRRSAGRRLARCGIIWRQVDRAL